MCWVAASLFSEKHIPHYRFWPHASLSLSLSIHSAPWISRQPSSSLIIPQCTTAYFSAIKQCLTLSMPEGPEVSRKAKGEGGKTAVHKHMLCCSAATSPLWSELPESHMECQGMPKLSGKSPLNSTRLFFRILASSMH